MLARTFSQNARKNILPSFCVKAWFTSSASAPIATAVKHQYALDSHLASKDPKALFAVFDLVGKQYKVAVDDTIVADNMEIVDLDSEVTVGNVMMVGGKEETLIGRPFIPNASVKLVVEEIAKDKKVYALKFRRRKNSQRLRGFRRQVTILRVTEIDCGRNKMKYSAPESSSDVAI